MSTRQTPRDPLAYVVRTERDPAALASEVRRAVARVDATLPPYDVRPLADYVEAAAAERRFVTILVGSFAAVATVLACLGVYGIISYGVTRRRQEFGVRLALGAGGGDLLRSILREGLRLAAVGLALGLPLAALAGWVLRHQLFGVAPFDPPTYLTAAAVLAVMALAASLVPGRRVLGASAMQALRAE